MFGRNSSRLFSTVTGMGARLLDSRIHFLDTNIVIYYMKPHENPFNKAVRKMFDDSASPLYYTETVRLELEKNLRGEKIPDRFSFKESGIHKDDKHYAIEMMKSLAIKRVNSGELEPSVLKINWDKYEQDFHIVFEAGFAGFDPEINTHLQEPLLLTRNLRFYNLVHSRCPSLIEDAINMSGLEHLVEVCNINSMIPSQELTNENTQSDNKDVTPTLRVK